MSNYEERLLRELRRLVAAEPVDRGRAHRLSHRPRRLALAGGGAAVLAAAVSAFVLLFSAGTQAAYAVTKDADGSVTVEIDSLRDAAGLQAKLQEAGVKTVVEYLPEGKVCQRPWFTPAGAGVGGNSGGTRKSEVGPTSDGTIRFTISGNRPAGTTLVITTQTGQGGERALGIAWAQGAVPPCQVVDAPAGSGPLGGPPAADTTTDNGRG
jgi:hypothetical protein